MAISAQPVMQGFSGPGILQGASSMRDLLDRYAKAKWTEKSRRENTDAKNLYKNIVQENIDKSIDYDAALKPFHVKHGNVVQQMTPQYMKDGQLDKKGLFDQLSKYNPELSKMVLPQATNAMNWDDVNEQFRQQVSPDMYRAMVGEEKKSMPWVSLGKDKLYNKETGETKAADGSVGPGLKGMIDSQAANQMHLIGDQTGYDQVRKMATARGLDTAMWPEQYSPETKDALLLSSIGDSEKAMRIIETKRGNEIRDRLARLKEERDREVDAMKQKQLDEQIRRTNAMLEKNMRIEERTAANVEFSREKYRNALPKYLKDLHVGKEQHIPQKAYNDVMDLVDVVPHAINTIEKIEDLFNVHGFQRMPGEVQADMASLMTTLQAQLKGDALLQLGVLNGGDMDFLLSMTGDPTSIANFSETGQFARLKNVKAYVGDKFETKMNAMGFKGASPKKILKEYDTSTIGTGKKKVNEFGAENDTDAEAEELLKRYK
jgi:hypothetical protein